MLHNNYYILTDRDRERNALGLCINCSQPNVEPMIDHDYEVDPETGIQSGTSLFVGWELQCPICAHDHPIEPVTVPRQMSFQMEFMSRLIPELPF